MKVWRIVPIIPLFFVFSCNVTKIEKFTTSATLLKTGMGEYDVATVLLGKLSITSPVYLDNVEESDSVDLPANVEPVNDAIVKIGGINISRTAPGVYSKVDMSLEYKKSYDLLISIGDTIELTSEAVVPDSFSIISPSDGDTLNMEGIRIIWHKSDSASFYVVYVDDAEDSATTVNGYENVVNDTTVVIPDSCFFDMDGNPVEGLYQIRVVAVNGAWKHGVTSFILGGGNVKNAWGTYAIMTQANNTLKVSVKNGGKR